MYAILNKSGAGSMKSALGKSNPVGELLRAELPDYLPWFSTWRTLRNDVKDGLNFGLVGPSSDIGITFNTITPDGGLEVDFLGRIVWLSDVARALESSGRVALFALAVATR